MNGQAASRWHRVATVLQAVLMLEAAGYVLMYCVLAFYRMRYPYELEWIEGAVVDSCIRLAHGLPVYTAPSIEFVPLIYNPLYLYVSAGAMRILGMTPLPLRLVSFLSSLGCMALIFMLARRETGKAWMGLVAAGLYAATFKAAGAWFDLAKSDSLFVFLFLAGVYAARRWRGLLGPVLCAVLLVLAYFAKQPGLVIIACLGLYYLSEGPKPFAAYAATVLVLGGGVTAWLAITTQGWYTFYTFRVVGQHSIEAPFLYLFWLMDILGNIPAVTLLSVLFLAPLARPLQKTPLAARDRFYICVAAGAVLVSWLGRLNKGGYLNVLMPTFAVAALALGWLLDTVWPRRLQAFALIILLMCVIQFGQLYYAPGEQVPGALDYAAGDQWIRILESFKGDVWAPYHGYYNVAAGKPMHAQWSAIADVIGVDYADQTRSADAEVEQVRRQLGGQIREAVRKQVFDAIILDRRDEYWADLMQPGYEYAGPVFDQPEGGWTLTGWRTRPQYIYVPRR